MGDVARWDADWEHHWPGSEPQADTLKHLFPDRWVRFHSLPGSTRYPQTEAEYHTVLARQHVLLRELLGGASELLVVTVAFADHPRGRRPGDVARAVPRARRWRAFETDDSEPQWPLWCSTFVSRVHLHHHSLAPLLRLVTDDRAQGVLLAPPDLAWLHHPYDGGADILAPTTDARDALRARHRDWLSPLPSGL